MAQHKSKDLPDIPEADAYSDVTAHEENLAETSGQNADMHRTTSDDGTIPPTAVREAITTGIDPASVATPEGDPGRQTAEGQPYLDDTNPSGRSLPNQQNHPVGGAGIWSDPQKRVSHEQPGVDATNPLPQALNTRSRRHPEG
jgi:hypothetical protein